MKNIKHSKVKAPSRNHYDWAIMPELYLATALLLCNEVLKCKRMDDDEINSQEILDNLEFSAHPNYEFVLPIVYNFKHGIELGIKSLGIMDLGEYQKVHDLKLLKDEILKTSKRTKNEKVILNLFQKTWPIIKKYYYGRYIPIKKQCNFSDKMNEAERFPNYSGKIIKNTKREKIYRIPDRIEWVTYGLISQIKKDILLLQKELNIAQRQIKPTKMFIYGRGSKFVN